MDSNHFSPWFINNIDEKLKKWTYSMPIILLKVSEYVRGLECLSWQGWMHWSVFKEWAGIGLAKVGVEQWKWASEELNLNLL